MLKYFDNYVEYPSLGGVILPIGIQWEYVSSSFLNGFLNGPTPIKAFLIHRYAEDPQVNQITAKKFNRSIGYHTKLSLGDDVLLLSYDKKTNEYWFFWLDNDVSDCSVGRFVTTDPKKVVIQEFVNEVVKTQEDLGYVDRDFKPLELDVKKFTGWLSL